MNGFELLSEISSAALIVVLGASYAACLALARLRASRTFAILGWLAYVGLATSAVVLVHALRLNAAWWPLVAMLLAGYWFLPRAIWRLSAATHRAH